MTLYKKANNLKKIINQLTNRYNVHWGNVLSLELWRMCTARFNLLKLFAGTLFYEFNQYILTSAKSDILIEYSIKEWNRKDYDEIINNLEKGLRNFDKLEVLGKKRRFLNIYKLIIVGYYSIKIRGLNFRERFIAANLIARRTGLARKYERIFENNRYKVVITFCDAHITSNLLVQVARKYGVETITLQHGQYVFYEPGTEVVHCETYENFISDYMFVWGEHTVEQLTKANIPRNRLIITGALKNTNSPSTNNVNKKVFGVVLSNAEMTSSNIELIKIANQVSEKLGCKYLIKPHPLDNPKKYSKIIDERKLSEPIQKNMDLRSYIEKVDFNLIHLSSVYIELLQFASPVFIYNNEYNLGKIGIEEERFSNIEEFIDRYTETFKEIKKWKELMVQRHGYYIQKDGLRNHVENIYRIRLLHNK